MDLRDIYALIRKGATPSDVARNSLLDNVSIAAFQDESEFIARACSPTIPGDTVGKYYVIDTDGIARDKAAQRAPGTEANEGQWDLTQDTYGCLQYGYKEVLPEELMKAAGPSANAETVTTKAVAEVLLINSEARFVSAYMSTGKWARDMAGASSNVADVSYIYWSTASTSHPVANVLAERTGMKPRGKKYPNVMIIGALVEPILLEHADVVGKLNNGQTPGGPAQASLADLAKMFKVDKVITASAVYNTSLSATASNSFIFPSKSVWMGYVNPTPAVMQPSALYRFADQQISGNAMGLRNWKYWDQDRRAWKIEGAVDDVYKLVSTKQGMWFDNIVA